MNDATKGYAVFFNDLNDPEEVGDNDNWEPGTIAFDNELKVLYVRTDAGWQFISAQTV